jgi:arginyl-tRNA synthetase
MDEFEGQISKIISDLFLVDDIDIELTRPDPNHGDYTTSVALRLVKKLTEATKTNPHEIAKSITRELKTNDQIKSVEVAGPGFINITMTDRALIKEIDNIGTYKPDTFKGKTVVAEYSDPNPFKVLHAGHLYTTIVGDAIASLVESSGARVHRLNYGGDVGLHVGKAMWAIVEYLRGENPDKLEEVDENNRLEWLSERYVEGTAAYEEDEAKKAQIVQVNKKVYQVHVDNDHDSPFAQIYWTCRDWSYKGFDALYEKLQIKPFEKYVAESEVTPEGLATTKKGLKSGVFEKSDGAVIFKGEEHGLHTRVFINSEGLPTYEAKDLGLAVKKWQDYHFDLNIIITANDIEEYMKVVLTALSSFYPEIADRTKHFTHGVIKLPGGVKMSSRLGNILRASDILDSAEKASKAINNDNKPEILLAAIKYAFLKSRIGGDIVYNPEESVSVAGNSGPYLQYSHARARSIIAKSSTNANKPESFDESERKLAQKISQYRDTISAAAIQLAPHLICTYLYELAQEFNRFYESNKVVGSEREQQRLFLVSNYADVLKNGLKVMGIHAPEKM